MPVVRFERYVAIGDSSTEGLEDRDGKGGYRGWSARLATKIAAAQGGLLYANLAVRGRSTREIRDQQLGPAVAMRPDLATVFSGTNDVLGLRFDAKSVVTDMELIQGELIGAGATVLTFTLPDLTPLMPIARWIAPRIHAMNQGLRRACARTGTILLDFADHPVATDARLWSEDRIHANALGHERIAEALYHALGPPDAREDWKAPLPPREPTTLRQRCMVEITWMRRHFLPWMLGLHAHSLPSPRPSRPELGPVFVREEPRAASPPVSRP